MTITTPKLHPGEHGGEGNREGGISMNVTDFKVKSEKKFGEVSNMILLASNKEFQKNRENLKLLIESRLNHPIFRDVKALTASAIFAKGFGKILCTKNLEYIAEKMTLLGKTDEAVEAGRIANEVRAHFSGDKDWNQGIHDRLDKLTNSIKTLEGKSDGEKETIAICSSLIDQIEGEIATNTITQLNGNVDVYRSHYFDFIAAMEKSSSDANELYKGEEAGLIEMKYVAGLNQLLEEGDDAVAAVTLLSEGFIGLTYMTIQKYVVKGKDIQEQGKEELNNFYQGHIELDGADTTDVEDTHLAMVKGMLSKVENRDKFMEYCKRFIALRQEVHDSLMKLS